MESPQCRNLTEITEKLGLFSMEDRLWHVQGYSSKTGRGVKEGLEELSYMISYTKKP